ncbi:HtaA domain-containing protein [Rhodococcus sp. KRD162]|uniref:HtaA domain-containing protein n=1 Tax=Rhodococcus sp. KRD162 TaxID=2729725 RepID=UPI0019D24AC0|nr:HtaA domain-containing protein [Rhodococcus sp. KRD162]
MSPASDRTELVWGVDAGFLQYIGGLPHGSQQCFDGCTPVGGEFTFPQREESNTVAGEYFFAGGIRFTGHDGLLDLVIAEPAVQKQDGRWVLTAIEPADPSRISVRSPLAWLPDLVTSVEGTSTHGTSLAPELTFEGTYLFGNVYRTGHRLAPLTFTADATRFNQPPKDNRSTP